MPSTSFNKLRVLDIFSGIGGLSLGLDRAGMETVAFCEIDPFCRKVLEKHWPGVPIFNDIKTLHKETLIEAGVINNERTIDVLVGGPPCQPVSLAGQRRGDKDDRWLWPEALRLVEEIHPAWCLFENPPGFLSMGFDETVSYLESQGYEVQAFIIPACGVDAPHRRDRVWIVAYADGRKHEPGSTQPDKRTVAGCDGRENGTMAYSASRKDNGRERGNMAEAAAGRQSIDSTVDIGREDVADTSIEGNGRLSIQPGGSQQANADTDRSSGSNVMADSCQPEHRGLSRPGRGNGEHEEAPGDGGRRTGQADGEWSTESRLGVLADGLPAIMAGLEWPTEPDIPRVATGIKDRVNKLKALGNAVVPQIVEIFGRMIMEAKT